MQNAWKMDHETWLGDAKQWEREHLCIRSAINTLVQKLRAYDALLDYHKHQIGDHKELIDLHSEAMNWNQKNLGQHAHHEIADLLELEEEAHVKEANIHKRLQELHSEILKGTMEAAIQLGRLS
jgi:hypothetical protein